MTHPPLHPAISHDALFGKSKAFIKRAIASKDALDFDQYQLWASLALELIAKSALAKIHPSLVADPNHVESLFAASGLSISTDIKTIGAKTAYSRISTISQKFDLRALEFSEKISLRRNSDLHSGETPFKLMKLESWEGDFWYTAQIILDISAMSLDEWLGADEARAPTAIVEHTINARREAAKIRIIQSKVRFDRHSKKEKEALLLQAKARTIYDFYRVYGSSAGAFWAAECPACSAKSFVAGQQVHEEIIDTIPGYWDNDGSYPDEEEVEREFSSEEFICLACDLHLFGQDEIDVAGLPITHTETERREREYEEEYGNE